MIFKDEIWLGALSNICSLCTSLLNLGLLGFDLLRKGRLDGAYLALIISDYIGDALMKKEQVFASFKEQDYEYNEELSEVWFKRSWITLHIGDAIKLEEILSMANPGRLFGLTSIKREL